MFIQAEVLKCWHQNIFEVLIMQNGSFQNDIYDIIGS